MESSLVHVEATHTIQCAEARPRTTLSNPFYLGPLDHLGSPMVPIASVWVYESSPQFPTPVLIARLSRAISLLLGYYPQLTGRLTIQPTDGLRLITQVGKGVPLVEAACSANLSDFRDSSTTTLSIHDLPGRSVALLPPWNTSVQGAQENPLLNFQHTRFACGSVAIGVQLSRLMCDAGGFLQLYKNLAELYSGIERDNGRTPVLREMPCITPFMAANVDRVRSQAAAAENSHPFGYFIGSAPATDGTADDALKHPTQCSEPPIVIGREIRFSASKLAVLKKMATPTDGTSFVSTFSALSAHFWQRSQLARLKLGGSATQQSVFFTSVDFSSKLALPSTHYFPSNVVTPHVQFSAGDLCNMPLSRVAKEIFNMTHSVAADDVRSLANWVSLQPQKQLIFPEIPFDSNAVIATAWNRYSLYDGAGLEVDVTAAGVPFTPTNLVDGLCFFLQPKENNGDIIAACSFGEPVWEMLDQDAEFRSFAD